MGDGENTNSDDVEQSEDDIGTDEKNRERSYKLFLIKNSSERQVEVGGNTEYEILNSRTTTEGLLSPFYIPLNSCPFSLFQDLLCTIFINLFLLRFV